MLGTGAIIGLTIVATGILGVALWAIFGRRRKPEGPDKTTELLLQQIGELRRDVDLKLGESSRAMQDSMKTQLTESSRIVKEVTEGLTKLDDTNKQVISFADQLQGLQDVLKNPKQRGVLGEYYLESVLKNVLPPGRYPNAVPFQK